MLSLCHVFKKSEFSKIIEIVIENKLEIDYYQTFVDDSTV
jgi:hypothetical protein